ncbi:hypothetical protein JXE04_01100 [Patescibacteria group bacterium]|nr:hypothetical protein [Patescibacteria group bacterium]
MKTDFSLYVGCALTYATEEFKQNVQTLKERLKKTCHVLEFIGLVDGTPNDVYNHDINVCVRGCDLFVGICDQASIGLGYELAVQIEDRKMPALAVAHFDSKITRLVLGINQPNFDFQNYKDFEDLYEIIVRKINELS